MSRLRDFGAINRVDVRGTERTKGEAQLDHPLLCKEKHLCVCVCVCAYMSACVVLFGACVMHTCIHAERGRGRETERDREESV